LAENKKDHERRGVFPIEVSTMSKRAKKAREEASEVATLEIGRQFRNWLSDYVALKRSRAISERRVVEQLLKYFRVLPEQQQEEILRSSSRPFDRIGEVVEVLPAATSVFRDTPHP
jgi:hypothetical protein